MSSPRDDDACMSDGVLLGDGEVESAEVVGGRRWRTAEQKLRIVEETLLPGVSVAQVAHRHGINANQNFQWRRQYRGGERRLAAGDAAGLLSVTVTGSPATDLSASAERQEAATPGGAIHIELRGCAVVSIEAGADHALVRTVLESLRA